MAPHSYILARRIPWTEEPGRLQSRGRKELDTTERLSVIRVSGIKYVYVAPSPLSRTFSFAKLYLCPHESIAGHPTSARPWCPPVSFLSL